MVVLPVPAPACRARWSPAWKASAAAVCSSVGFMHGRCSGGAGQGVSDGCQEVGGRGVGEQVLHGPVEAVGLVAGVLGQGAVQGQLHEEFWGSAPSPGRRGGSMAWTAGGKARLSRTCPSASG